MAATFRIPAFAGMTGANQSGGATVVPLNLASTIPRKRACGGWGCEVARESHSSLLSLLSQNRDFACKRACGGMELRGCARISFLTTLSSLISPKIAISPRYGLPNAPAFHTIYPRAETRAQEIHAGDDDHDTRGTRRVPKADSASDAGDRVLLAQGGAARALDTALHRLRTALLLPAPALPRPGLHVRQGGVVPGVRARDAVLLHDQPPPRARLRGRRALRHRHHPAGRGPADDGQHRRDRKTRPKTWFWTCRWRSRSRTRPTTWRSPTGGPPSAVRRPRRRRRIRPRRARFHKRRIRKKCRFATRPQ